MFKEFRKFIARGNAIDLAVAVIIGAAFGKIVTDLVEGRSCLAGGRQDEGHTRHRLRTALQ